jgi:hypothetical protein
MVFLLIFTHVMSSLTIDAMLPKVGSQTCSDEGSICGVTQIGHLDSCDLTVSSNSSSPHAPESSQKWVQWFMNLEKCRRSAPALLVAASLPTRQQIGLQNVGIEQGVMEGPVDIGT